MCGITGFVGPGSQDDLAAMSATLAHRGPDGSGSYHDAEHRVFLGHRRLAIVDIAGGAQPMWNADGMIGVVFNGEIYNQYELRRELEALGFHFSTDHSDTEVLIHGYSAWGEDLPRRLNGMFAFCIYDRLRLRLFLARDRFGEKPLFFARQGNLFAFASELSALSRHSFFSSRLRRLSLQKYFAYGYIPAPNALLEDCEKLPGGAALFFDLTTKEIRKRTYWQFRIEPDDSWLQRTEADLAEELRSLLSESVRKRLSADVDVGFFVSGGIDSSAVLATASRLLPNERLRAFTLGFTEPSFDETAAACTAAKAFGAQLSIEWLSYDRATNAALDVLSRMDEPVGDASLLPTALLARFARQHVKVVLSGDGADELFGGYDPFRALAPAQIYRALVPRPLHALLRQVAGKIPASDRNMGLDFKLKRTLAGLSYAPEFWNPLWLAPADPKLISDLFAEPVAPEELYSEAIEVWDAAKSKSLVDRTLEFYTNFYLQGGILTKVDRATMMSSLESRAVFLDNDIVTFCAKLPSTFKLRGRQTKYLLKKAMKDLLPAENLARPKKGFGFPVAKWLKSVPNELFLAGLDGAGIDVVQKAYHEHQTGKVDQRLFLWSWLALNAASAVRTNDGSPSLATGNATPGLEARMRAFPAQC